MDSSKVVDRLRSILNSPRSPQPTARPRPLQPPRLEEILGGQWREHPSGRSFVVERCSAPDAACGTARVVDVAARLEGAARHASLFTRGRPSQAPLIFFDLETTGLSGGAGTYAFLVGIGSFSDDGMFVTRQYLLLQHEHERAMLDLVAGELARAGTLVSFNGKSFDAPLLETRYLFHRLDWIGAELPHLDLLPPARLFWSTAEADPSTGSGSTRATSRVESLRSTPRDSEAWRANGGRERVRRAEAPGSGGGADAAIGNRGAPREMNDGAAGCSLIALERRVLGAGRGGDVSGFEIPSRYFHFLRSGDAQALGPVLQHNRLDLLALAGLTARLLQLVGEGPDQVRDAAEAVALGRVYRRAGYENRAEEAFHRALELIRSMPHASATATRVDALRFLALTARRARRYQGAAGWWRQLLDVAECPRHIAREALEALAVHHEHRMRDLGAARMFALESLEAACHNSAAVAARHRLRRLDRKLAADRGNATIPFEA